MSFAYIEFTIYATVPYFAAKSNVTRRVEHGMTSRNDDLVKLITVESTKSAESIAPKPIREAFFLKRDHDRGDRIQCALRN